ncbi:hypothetical protein LXL04_017841 [Taraxacum kok-saghyz]
MQKTAQSNEMNVISSDASKLLEVSDDSSVEIIEYASCFSPYKSQLSREFSEEMEKWEKKMKRKRALANVIIVSDDDEAPEDEFESSAEEVDTATSKWTGEEGSSNAQLDLELTLRPPGPTAEDVERELSSFLSSFGNKRVDSNVLKRTTIKLQLDVASTAKILKIQELMRDMKGRPTHAYKAKDVLLKRVAKWDRDQTRDAEVIRLASALRAITRTLCFVTLGVVHFIKRKVAFSWYFLSPTTFWFSHGMNPPPLKKIPICAPSQDRNPDLHPHGTITPYLRPAMLDLIAIATTSTKEESSIPPASSLYVVKDSNHAISLDPKDYAETVRVVIEFLNVFPLHEALTAVPKTPILQFLMKLAVDSFVKNDDNTITVNIQNGIKATITNRYEIAQFKQEIGYIHPQKPKNKSDLVKSGCPAVWQVLIHLLLRSLSGKSGGTDSLNLLWTDFIYSIWSNRPNAVDVPQLLWDEFILYTSKRKNQEMPLERFWALTLEAVYKEHNLNPTPDDDSLVCTFTNLKGYKCSDQSRFGTPKRLPKHMLDLLSPTSPYMNYHLAATEVTTTLSPTPDVDSAKKGDETSAQEGASTVKKIKKMAFKKRKRDDLSVKPRSVKRKKCSDPCENDSGSVLRTVFVQEKPPSGHASSAEGDALKMLQSSRLAFPLEKHNHAAVSHRLRIQIPR